MKKVIKGILMGLAIAVVFHELLYHIAIRIQPVLVSIFLIGNLVPLLIGTILTGESIGKNGWKYGLLVVLGYLIYIFIEVFVHYNVYVLLWYIRPDVGKLLTYFAYFLIGALGGHLGQLIAQKRQKKRVE